MINLKKIEITNECKDGPLQDTVFRHPFPLPLYVTIPKNDAVYRYEHSSDMSGDGVPLYAEAEVPELEQQP